MAYLQASIETASVYAEVLSDALMDHGALSTAIQDAFAGTDKEQPIFGEPGEPLEQMWDESIIISLFDEDADVAAIIAAAAAAVKQPVPEFKLETLPDQDWVRLTQAQFDPIQISKRLWITPTWHEAPDASAINLKLDPGLAFGTGSHPTTRLCLEWLDNHIQGGESVLDYGCGSGILAIAAVKLGAASALGIDIDTQAVRASRDNADQNNITNAVFTLPDAAPEGTFDVVVANILANPLRMLGEMLASRTNTGGTIVLSGILAEQADELVGIYQTWFNMHTPVFLDGWTCLSGTKR
ncbi:MAG: 50S ribosomal protein L11 methyltransferase [Neisseriaceae bacterium]|nr:50S ribosomal protein L11 methyltransferase [Neisseriaceae bacterium]MBP6860816.1 50S ribosomal protein L11 methyltransferase [Neisseriaceae bacterium]